MRRSPLLPIFLIVLVDVLGLTIVLPLLPFYAERLGASPFVASLLVSVYAACQLVSGPLLGRMSDRMGRKPLLLVSQVGTLAGFLVLANAEVLWLVFLARILDGLTAGNLSLAQAYIADVTTPENRSSSFAIIGIAFGLGFLVGPAASGYLSVYGLHVPFYAASGLSLVSILATAVLLPANPPRPEGAAAEDEGPAGPGGKRLSLLAWGTYAQYFQRPELARLLSQFFCFTLAFAIFTGGFALWAERRLGFDARHTGYLFAYAGFLGIVLQGGLIKRLVRRFGDKALSSAGFVGFAVGYALLAGTFGIPLLLVAATFSSFGQGVLRPTLTSLITQQVGRREQGTVLGLNQSLLSVAQILGPLLGGAIIERGWLSVWPLLMAAVAVLGFAIRSRAVVQQGAQ